MYPIILPPVGQTGLVNLGMATSSEKENSQFKHIKLNFKIDLV